MRFIYRISFLIFSLIWIISGCNKSVLEIPEEVILVIDPLEGLTTDTLQFQIETIPEFNSRSTFFYRWDWQGDSVWDTEFSALSSIEHRYFAPGKYTVNLQCTNGKGESVFTKQEISILQGYSKPIPHLLIEPESGNYTQEFIMDARTTFDFEDSLSDLKFRWDLEGDGMWDHQFDTITLIHHVFNKPGIYFPVLEVRDPSGLFASVTKRLEVHKTDTLIQIVVDWFPKDISDGDVVEFDLSSSTYLSDPDRDFKVSWLFPFTFTWTEPSREKQYQYVIQAEGENLFGCKLIMDYTELENETYFEIFASVENLPPEPSFEVSIEYGNLTTLFYFNCWSSRDDHTTPSQLLIRWDWDNDEIWDTPFTQQKEYYHQYQKPGRYGVILEAKDEKGLMARAYGTINVSPYENPTSMIKDRRDDQLYGTVQIGDQWWMAENLRFQVPEKMESGLVTTICLYESESWCEQVGLLYQVTAISHDRFDDKYIQVCPDGWHLPTKEDWEELIENIGGNNKAHDLVIGGSTDFNGRYLGLGDFALIGFPVPTDTIFTFKETFESMYYPSSTIPVDINEARTDIFVIKVTKDNSSFWTGFMSTRYYMPVRCVMDR